MAALSCGAVAAEDAYIESSGGTAINTGYFVKPSTRIEIDFEYTVLTKRTAVFGGPTSSSSPSESGAACMLYINSSGNIEPAFGRNATPGSVEAPAKTERRTAVFDFPDKSFELYAHGSATAIGTKSMAAADVGSGHFPLMLFARGTSVNGMVFNLASSCRIYSFKAYENGTIVKEFVPCVKGDVPGFRDVVDGTFHTGECVVGLSASANTPHIPDDGFVELAGNDQTKESNDEKGGHYIDTGYLAGPNTRIELDYAFAANRSGSGDWYMLASAQSTVSAENQNYFSFYAQATSLRASLGSSGSIVTGLPVQTNAMHVRRTAIFDSPNKAVTILTSGYVNYANTNDAFSAAVDQARTLKLGATAGLGGGFAPLRIYGLKIYESDSLVRDYVPCVTNGAPGLRYGSTFVKVSHTATYGKAGMPKAGGDVAVSSERDRDAFVLFTGAQSIDTGYNANGNSKFVVDFAFANAHNSSQQFVLETGNSSSGELCGRIYTSGSGGTDANYAWSYAKSGSFTSTGVSVDHQRRLFTIDAANDQVRMEPGSYNGDSKIAGMDNDYNCPQSTRIGSNVGGTGHFAKIRLYRLTIWEGAEKKREFVPYTDGTNVGLYDLVGNQPYTAAGLSVGGHGHGGAEEWISRPSDATLLDGDTATLSACAVGAVAYRWTRNGDVIPGEDGGELSVSWVRRGATDVYTVTPVYDVFGTMTNGEPVSCNVISIPRGSVLIVF